jgi:hypothetical protein
MLGPDEVIQHFPPTNPLYLSAKLVFTLTIGKRIPNAGRGNIAFQIFETMHRTIYLAS